MLTDGCLRLRERLVRLQRDEAGQGLVEYSMILIAVALVLVVVVALIGTQTKNDYSNISNSYPH